MTTLEQAKKQVRAALHITNPKRSSILYDAYSYVLSEMQQAKDLDDLLETLQITINICREKKYIFDIRERMQVYEDLLARWKGETVSDGEEEA